MPTQVYDHTRGVLKAAVSNATLGRDDQLHALKRLDAEARRLEAFESAVTFEGVVREERARSAEYGGRSVFGWEPPAVEREVS